MELLKEAGFSFTVKEYLKEPLTVSELKNLFSKLGKDPIDVIRKKETLFKELDLSGKELNLDEWIDIIIKHPKLLERPILLTESKAIIGRPPENFKQVLN